MSDYNSELPVRSQLPSQVNPDDLIIKLGDATNPTTQLATVDTFGSQQTVIKDAAGNAVASQSLAATRWLQTVFPPNGPASPGTAAAYSMLAGGIYNLTPPTLTFGQQASLQLDLNGRLLVDTLSSDDHNYGVVGATTLRSAAQIGNATGAADFNAGLSTAQTLRTASNISDSSGNALSAIGGSLHVNVTNFPAYDENYGIVGVTTLRSAAQVGNATGAADFNFGVIGAQTLRTGAQVGNATGAADFNNGVTGAQTLRVAANLASSGVDISAVNPLPVTIEDAPGIHINDFKDATAIAKNASDNHDYTVPAAKTFHLNQIESSASGEVKMQVQVETGVATSIFNTVFVQFNSTSNPNMRINLMEDILVAAGVRVRVIMTNKDNGTMDLYSTICGFEV